MTRTTMSTYQYSLMKRLMVGHKFLIDIFLSLGRFSLGSLNFNLGSLSLSLANFGFFTIRTIVVYSNHA